jgi:DNA-binding LacI/PurR family transcriptional regulator
MAEPETDHERLGSTTRRRQEIVVMASPSTPRGVSGRRYVSTASREQALAAAGELGYVPKELARRRITRHSGLVVQLVPVSINKNYIAAVHGSQDVSNPNRL